MTFGIIMSPSFFQWIIISPACLEGSISIYSKLLLEQRSYFLLIYRHQVLNNSYAV